MVNKATLILTALFFMLICQSGSAAWAQQNSFHAIIPGSDELITNRLHPYSYEFELTIVGSGKEQHFGTLHDEVHLLGDDIVERVQVLKGPNQPDHVDSVQASFSTLAPISHSSVNKNRSISLSFSPSGVTGTFAPANSDPVPVGEAFNQPYFDSNWVDLAIRLLPLKADYRGTLQTHEVSSDGQSGFVAYRIRVAGQDRIQDGTGKKAKVWVVNQDKKGKTTTYYIKADSVELLKMEIPLRDDKKMVMRRLF